MALTSIEKARCRLYLGFPQSYRYKNTRLESMLESMDDDSITLVREALANLVLVQAALVSAGVTGAASVAGIKRVDEIWFDNNGVTFAATGQIRSMGRKFISEISIIVGCPIYSDYYSGRGYTGDSFSGGGTPGNMFPLG